MDATTLRIALAVVGVLILVGIYLYSRCQSRMRQRSAAETFTREEIDSAFIEDEQLRDELDHINVILEQQNDDESLDLSELKVSPALKADLISSDLPDINLYLPDDLTQLDDDMLIKYFLKHTDHRLISSEEIEEAINQYDLILDEDGCLCFQQNDQRIFRISNLSRPGDFSSLGDIDFSCLGFNCFIRLDEEGNHRHNYEVMLKKIDELVRLMGTKVFLDQRQLLTLKDITDVREKLNADGFSG
ncbi:MAG: FtsZ-interacting cell division protein ZipA [Gammaproteobacteria bacterium]|jgi:FtsZ-interacting cell division protein ZipA